MTTNPDRVRLYQLIESQLRDDGHYLAAAYFKDALGLPVVEDVPKNRLLNLVTEAVKDDHPFGPTRLIEMDDGGDVDLDMKGSVKTKVATPMDKVKDMVRPEPVTKALISHMQEVTSSAYSPDGSIVATGSVDKSVKIINTRLAMLVNQETNVNKSSTVAKPVKRTLYSQAATVTALAFHPYRALLTTGSEDAAIQLFEYSKGDKKDPLVSMKDGAPIINCAWDPAGERLLVAAKDLCFRLIDFETMNIYTSPDSIHLADKDMQMKSKPQYKNLREPHHLTNCAFASDATTFSTCDTYGMVRTWDRRTLEMTCELIPERAVGCHVGIAYSAIFSRCTRYMLTSGICNGYLCTRLWDRRNTSKQLVDYERNKASWPKELSEGGVIFPNQAFFSHDESMVIFMDNYRNVYFNETSTGTPIQKLETKHQNEVLTFAVSPNQRNFITGSADTKIRYWAY